MGSLYDELHKKTAFFAGFMIVTLTVEAFALTFLTCYPYAQM